MDGVPDCVPDAFGNVQVRPRLEMPYPEDPYDTCLHMGCESLKTIFYNFLKKHSGGDASKLRGFAKELADLQLRSLPLDTPSHNSGWIKLAPSQEA